LAQGFVPASRTLCSKEQKGHWQAMRVMQLFLFATASAVGTQNTITQVTGLLQEMLDKSKTDGTADRTVFAKFKCYCDTNTEEKKDSIEAATLDIETMEAALAQRRSQNAKLSQEVAKLKSQIDENVEGRGTADTLRGEENTDFGTEEADLETGIDQLGRAIDILSAVGADQTVSGDISSSQLLSADATANAEEVVFLKKGGIVSKKLTEDQKTAIRAAAVHLSGKERKAVTSFISMEHPGNYGAQSGEIVGVIKEMKDTFTSNLASARKLEAKRLGDYDALILAKTDEHTVMTESWESKKQIIGDNAAEIATTASEVDTRTGTKGEDDTFLIALTDRCNTKAKEFEHRNMLRTNEESAIAQAISILDSDASFKTFGTVDATSTGATSAFIQLGNSPSTRAAATKLLQGKAGTSARIQKVIASLKAGNPFEEVLTEIRGMITLMDKEATEDTTKKGWCESEQSNSNSNKEDRENTVSTLGTNLANLQISAGESQGNIDTSIVDLKSNRDSQAAEQDTRKNAGAQFEESFANLKQAEKILSKAIEVLTKYYDWLHKHNGAHSYTAHVGKDSGGQNLKRIDGAECTTDCSVLEEACSAMPECVGFNSAGWLKSALTEEDQWYDWEGGTLFVKTFDATRTGLIQTGSKLSQEPDTWGDEMEGQGSDGNSAISMLEFIASETEKEKNTAIDNEKTAQSQFETNMNELTSGEQALTEALAGYQQDLATTNKEIEETKESSANTQADLDSIIKYLASIEPGCTFMITNYDTRATLRATEKTALEGAITTLEGTPAFQNAKAAAEREALGECADTCETEGETHAKCQACLEKVTVAGYCAQNSSADGCSDATATTSAAALA